MTRAALLLAATACTWAIAGPAEAGRAIAVEHDPPGRAPAEGPDDALVTLELFVAPGDGARSARAFRLIQELRDRHPDSIRVRYRIVGRSGHSDYGAEAAREAFAQGRFLEYLREAYRNGRSPRRSELPEVAELAGVDVQRLEQALADERHADAVRQAHAARQRLRVSRVPGLLIGGVPFDGPVRSLDALEEAYAAAESRAQELASLGVPRSRLYERMLREVELAQPAPRVGEGLVDGVPPDERRGGDDAPRYVGAMIDLRGRHSRGAEAASVPVVLYCTFASRYCAQMHQHVEALRLAFPDDVRVVFKHAIGGGVDVDAARRLHAIALCADEQGAFWDAHDWLYSRSRAGRGGAAEQLAAAAEALELDVQSLSSCAEAGRAAAALDQALAETAAVGIDKTPSVVIGGRLYEGTKTFSELRELVARELAPGILERAVALPPM